MAEIAAWGNWNPARLLRKRFATDLLRRIAVVVGIGVASLAILAGITTALAIAFVFLGKWRVFWSRPAIRGGRPPR